MADIGVTEQLEFWGKVEGVGKAEEALEIGDETLDFASVVDFGSNFIESVVEDGSCLGGAWGCLIIPYKTSAISISISSWAMGDGFEDLSGRSLGPVCFYNSRRLVRYTPFSPKKKNQKIYKTE